MQLVKDVFAYVWQGQGNNCNSYALRYQVDGVPKYVLIDPGHEAVTAMDPRSGQAARMYQEPGLETLIVALHKDGIEPQDIPLIVNTHGHMDHCDAGFALAARTGARVGVHEKDREMCNRTARDMFGIGPEETEKKKREPDLFLEEGELRLGQPEPILLRILHTPGHSPGSISIYWSEKKVLIAGDVMFYRSTGRWDLPGGDLGLLRQSVARLAELDCEYLLTGHPYGHPGIIKGKKEIQANFSFALSNVLA